MHKTDVLIIGSGIAGLTTAIKLAETFPQKKITVVTKNKDESNTQYAQGGIAVVAENLKDSFQQHVDDTLRAGAGGCNREVVEMVVAEAPDRLKELMSWGAAFDRNITGELNLGLEGGHSAHRIVHVKDQTGLHVAQLLQRKAAQLPNLEWYSHHFCLDLIISNTTHKETDSGAAQQKCVGAYVLNIDSGQVETVVSKVTVLATGGAGQVYRVTTNPAVATGDGIAMAHRAKALMKDMAFVQFHPTALYTPYETPSSLISEAVRGYGAYLVNHYGERFMLKYDNRAELASRDIVSKAIDIEMKADNRESVFLDCRHLNPEDFKNKFPSIYHNCRKHGYDPARNLIPVVPAAHYFCGGVEVNRHGHTSIDRLYACGECACTGMHGTNRLASNSLLEALVYAHHCFVDIKNTLGSFTFPETVPAYSGKGLKDEPPKKLIASLRKELNNLMSDQVAITRSHKGLLFTLRRLQMLQHEVEEKYSEMISVPLLELKNLLTVAKLVAEHSLAEKQNRSSFHNTNLPAALTI